MVRLEIAPSDWIKYVGKDLGISDWYKVTQEEITEFGRVTGDMQWIHVDPTRAKEKSPYKGTVAHGNWLISISHSKLFLQIYQPIKTRMVINYGWNKIRFPAPTPVGKRIRLQAAVNKVDEVEKGAYQVEFDFKVYVEGENKPCFAALKLTRYYS
ncbi:MAG: MaoC family dehydratase [Candidatus Hermodarchaeota archaeon]